MPLKNNLTNSPPPPKQWSLRAGELVEATEGTTPNFGVFPLSKASATEAGPGLSVVFPVGLSVRKDRGGPLNQGSFQGPVYKGAGSKGSEVLRG